MTITREESHVSSQFTKRNSYDVLLVSTISRHHTETPPSSCLKTTCFIISHLLHQLAPWKCNLKWDSQKDLLVELCFTWHYAINAWHYIINNIHQQVSDPLFHPSFSGNLQQSNNCTCMSGPSTRRTYTDCSVGQFHLLTAQQEGFGDNT